MYYGPMETTNWIVLSFKGYPYIRFGSLKKSGEIVHQFELPMQIGACQDELASSRYHAYLNKEECV
jgi:hypothetical protein